MSCRLSQYCCWSVNQREEKILELNQELTTLVYYPLILLNMVLNTPSSLHPLLLSVFLPTLPSALPYFHPPLPLYTLYSFSSSFPLYLPPYHTFIHSFLFTPFTPFRLPSHFTFRLTIPSSTLSSLYPLLLSVFLPTLPSALPYLHPLLPSRFSFRLTIFSSTPSFPLYLPSFHIFIHS